MLDELKELIFGIAGEEAMPARVKQHIRRAQEDSEVLIGWVQLAGSGFCPGLRHRPQDLRCRCDVRAGSRAISPP